MGLRPFLKGLPNLTALVSDDCGRTGRTVERSNLTCMVQEKKFIHHTGFDLFILDLTSLYWIRPPYAG